MASVTDHLPNADELTEDELLEAECARYGLPTSLHTLLRHLRNNFAALTGAKDAIVEAMQVKLVCEKGTAIPLPETLCRAIEATADEDLLVSDFTMIRRLDPIALDRHQVLLTHAPTKIAAFGQARKTTDAALAAFALFPARLESQRATKQSWRNSAPDTPDS